MASDLIIPKSEKLRKYGNQLLVDAIFSTLPLTYNKAGINFRQAINPKLVEEFRTTLPHKVRVLRNDYVSDGKPTEFVANHVFKDDIASVCCAVSESMSENMYLVADSDSKKDIKLIEALALYLNGVIFFEKDRKLAKENERDILNRRTVKVLKCGGNILIFPESTWNFRHNKLIRDDLPWGLLTNADQAEANVVPVAIDLVGDEYLVIIGKKLERVYDKAKDIVLLEDEMATLVWELYGLKEPLVRANLGEDEIDWYNYVQEKCDGGEYDFVKEERCAFRLEGKFDLDEVIADMYGINYRSIASGYDTYKRIRRLSDSFSGIERRSYDCDTHKLIY